MTTQPDMLDLAADDPPLYPEPAEAVEVGIALVLDVLAEQADALTTLAGQVATLQRELTELREDVRPALEAVAQLGPMAEKMAQGGILGMLRS